MTNSDSAIVVFITKDLFFVPMIRQATERAGHTLVVAPSIGNPRLESLQSADVAVCILDLTSVAHEEIAGAAMQLRDRFAKATLAAFGPHVHEQHLNSAAQSGFDSVLTRGQLNKNPDQWIAAWMARKDVGT